MYLDTQLVATQGLRCLLTSLSLYATSVEENNFPILSTQKGVNAFSGRSIQGISSFNAILAMFNIYPTLMKMARVNTLNL